MAERSTLAQDMTLNKTYTIADKACYDLVLIDSNLMENE